jgi:hypothetical protein
MKELFYLLPLLALVIFFSGCIGQVGGGVVVNVITVNDISISTINPSAGSTTTLSFNVQNNIDKMIGRVEVNFFDIPGFSVSNLTCDIIPESGDRIDGNSCIFNNTDRYDVRRVSLTLRAPNSSIIRVKTPFTISYYVKYNWSAFRKANIPVIDGITRTTPVAKFSQSNPEQGPVAITFEPPVGKTEKKDGTIVKEYWGLVNTPFEVKINLAHVGSSSVGSVQPINISELKIDLKQTLKRAMSDGTYLPCDFENATPEEKYILYVDILKESVTPSPSKIFNIRPTLKCNFEPVDKNMPEIMATIEADAKYTYQFIRSETLTVEPVPEE